MLSLVQRIIMPTLAMIWATMYFFEVMQLSDKNHYLINPVFYVMAILYIVNTINDVKKWNKERSIDEKKKVVTKSKTNNKDVILIGMVVIISVVYLMIMPKLGFVISTYLFLLAQLIVLKSDNKIMILALPIVLTGILYYAFTQLLGIPLPVGILKNLGVF